jgi:ferritin-like metal-binding protein YciE
MKMATKSKARNRTKESPDAQQLLVMELQQIHSAESQLARALPRLSKAVQSETLREMLDQRLEEGERILKELEAAFDALEESPGRRKNVAAEGLIGDVREHTQEIAPGPALDAVLLAGIQKTEHYCIAAWGTAKSLAQLCEEKTTVRAMERALKEGKSYDEKLTQLAEGEINPALESAEEESDESEGEEGEQSGDGQRRTRGREGSERRTSG